MGSPKTIPTETSPEGFLATIDDPVRRQDAQDLLALMESATGAPATMWGEAIVGFGTHGYTLASGKPATTLAVGFAPRKAAFVLYGVLGVAKAGQGLGRHTSGRGCLYIKRLSDVDQTILHDMIRTAFVARNDEVEADPS